MRHNLVILLGVQGSGKGTVAAELMHSHDYDYIETGALFRGFDRTSPLGAEIGAVLDAGGLVSDDLAWRLVKSRLNPGKDILADGFPRTLHQAGWLLDWANAHDFATRVVLLNIPRATALQRIRTRAAEGGGRTDDSDPAAVARRLDIYYKQTEPMEKFLKNAPGVRFFDIDGTKGKEAVLQSVREQLAVSS